MMFALLRSRHEAEMDRQHADLDRKQMRSDMWNDISREMDLNEHMEHNLAFYEAHPKASSIQLHAFANRIKRLAVTADREVA